LKYNYKITFPLKGGHKAFVHLGTCENNLRLNLELDCKVHVINTPGQITRCNLEIVVISIFSSVDYEPDFG
jgi:hypothetical protein